MNICTYMYSVKKNSASTTQTLGSGPRGTPRKEVGALLTSFFFFMFSDDAWLCIRRCTQAAARAIFFGLVGGWACVRAWWWIQQVCHVFWGLGLCVVFSAAAGRDEYVAFLEATVASKMKAAIKDRRKRVRKATKEFDALVHKLMENVRLRVCLDPDQGTGLVQASPRPGSTSQAASVNA